MSYQIRKRQSKSGIRYSVVIEVWHNGQRKVISGGTFDNQKEAERAGIRLEDKYETNPSKRSALSGHLPLSDWATEWLTGLVVKEVKQTTRETYRWRMNRWVLPTLGNTKLVDLEPRIIRRWLGSLELGLTSKRHALAVLRTCLKAAVEDGLLTDDPSKGIKVRGTKSIKKAAEKPVKVWSYEQAGKLLEGSVGHRAEALVVLGLFAGLRPGETGALLWSDVDFLAGTVTVSKTRSLAGGRVFYEDSTKTGETRTVKLPFEAVQRLVRIQEAQPFPNSGKVFPYDRNAVHRSLKALCEKVGVPALGAHSLRHTCASLALSQGAPVTAVSKMLGHSNIQTTQSTYLHALPEDVDQIPGMMERALGVQTPQVPAGPNSDQREATS